MDIQAGSELISQKTANNSAGISPVSENEATIKWLERTLPRIMRILVDAENLELPLLQLPLAQLRLAQSLYSDTEDAGVMQAGETMGRLSEKLAVRQNALTQAADRLIHRGLAERISDPHDRRIVRMRLTETGREWVAARRARRRAHLASLWTTMPPQEQQDFLHAVRTLEAAGDRFEAKQNTQEEG